MTLARRKSLEERALLLDTKGKACTVIGEEPRYCAAILEIYSCLSAVLVSQNEGILLFF